VFRAPAFFGTRATTHFLIPAAIIGSYLPVVRTHIGSALIILSIGCSTRDYSAEAGGVPTTTSGPDPIVIRVSRSGGSVRAYRYPRLDSLLWKSTDAAPALTSLLAFDQENGVVAYLDRKGQPGWIDLRVGTVVSATKAPLSDITSSDGWAIYGVRKDSVVLRLTPSGDWSLALKGRVSQLFALPDGSLVALADRGGSRLFRLRPPEVTLLDSAAITRPQVTAVSPLGDRLFFAMGHDVISVGGQSLRIVGRSRLRDEIVALASTPSGDRIFAATRGGRDVDVIARYNNRREAAVRLPGPVSDLRMDPLGRMVLARPVRGDSAWIISVGTNRFVGTVATEWRLDLPFVAPDGLLATVQGGDVAFVAPGERRARIIVRQGALELWMFVQWSGFRPRAKGLDQPVVFPEESASFSAPVSVAQDSGRPRPARTDTTVPRSIPVAPLDTSSRPAPARDGWTVSFAAVLSEDRARELARQIRVDGQQARVVVNETEGIRVHRVVLGPYPTRADAERVGRAAGRSYWVFEGPP
jgi:cell division septation protein DedD